MLHQVETYRYVIFKFSVGKFIKRTKNGKKYKKVACMFSCAESAHRHMHCPKPFSQLRRPKFTQAEGLEKFGIYLALLWIHEKI